MNVKGVVEGADQVLMVPPVSSVDNAGGSNRVRIVRCVLVLLGNCLIVVRMSK